MSSSPGIRSSPSFRSLLGQLVFDLIDAHERELAGVRSEQAELQKDHAAQFSSLPSAVVSLGEHPPTSQLILPFPPEQVETKVNRLNSLWDSSRHWSMSHNSVQPTQPMLDLEPLVSDKMRHVDDVQLMSDSFNVQPMQPTIDLEPLMNPLPADEPKMRDVYGEVHRIADVDGEVRDVGPSMHFSDGHHQDHHQLGNVRQSIQKVSMVALPEDYVGQLRTQFERLDPDEFDRISLDQCMFAVDSLEGTNVTRQDLIDVLTQAHRMRVKQEGLSATTKQFEPDEQGSYWISFEDFVYVMACGDFENDASFDGDTSLDVVRDVQVAIHAFEDIHTSLAAKAERTSLKYTRVVALLDCIPAPVIVMNALAMGLRADMDPDAFHWKILDIFFLIFYIGEAVVKFCVFGCKIYCLGPGFAWNWFDLVCIAVSLCDVFVEFCIPVITQSDKDTELGDIMLIKMLRLGKLARLVKALRYSFFTELKVMVYGVVSGVRVIFWAIVLLFVCVYFFGAVMNNLVGDERKEFDTVASSMFTIFRCFTDGCSAYDGTPLTEHLNEQFGALFVIPYAIVFMFITIGVFNLIMATFIDNVVSTTQARKQEELGNATTAARSSLQMIFIKLITTCMGSERCLSVRLQNDVEKMARRNVGAAFNMLPRDLTITKSVFTQWLAQKEFIDALEDTDVDTSNTSSLYDVLDADMSGGLTLKELIHGLMSLRGPITKCDIISVRMQVQCVMEMLSDLQTHFNNCVEDHKDSISASRNGSQKELSKRDLMLPRMIDTYFPLAKDTDVSQSRHEL